MQTFINNDDGYLAWVHSNPTGFVANVDQPQYVKQYPMVHRASHKAVTTSKRGNYTTARYYKVCSTDLAVLEAWSKATFNKKLTYCKSCL
jgi:hypothetical protein